MRSSPTCARGTPTSGESSFIRIRLLLVLSALSLSALGLLAAPVPTNKPSTYPAWWFGRSVIVPLNPTDSTPNWPGSYPTSDDYAVINQGQLKNFATQAYNELQAHAPSWVWSTSQGAALSNLITNWNPANGDAYAVVNLGQLKTVAQPFYDVLIQIGYTNAYPWTGVGADDYSVANIGQAKNLFSFDVGLDSDNNGLPDWWEMKYFGQTGNGSSSDPDGNGLTLLQDYQQGNDPTNYYSQGGSLLTPVLAITGGNNQTSPGWIFLPQPLIVQVTNSNGGTPLVNAPVMFTVSTGGGQLATDQLGATATVLQVKTDLNGQALVYYQQPNSPNVTSTITATTAGQSVSFTEVASGATATPTVTPAAGHYAVQQTVTVSDVVPGATIYYTTDGTDPTMSSPVASGGTIQVTQTEVLKVMAVATGYDSSAITTAVYQIGSNDLVAGDSFTLVQKPDGTIWTWGDDSRGQQGDNQANNPAAVPQPVPNLSGMTSAAATGEHALAVDSNGYVWAWGADDQSQCGDGGTTDLLQPTQINFPSDDITIATVYAGPNNGFAVDSNGNLYGWGDNTYGQLGDGTTNSQGTPEAISSMAGVVKIASSPVHTLALKSDGTVWATGLNDVSQLGDGTTNSVSLFQPVPGLAHVVDIAVGITHSMALLADGTVWTWGLSSNGQLGDGNNDLVSTPQQVLGLPPAVAIEAVDTKSYVILADGTVRCFGSGFEGQMGLGTTQDQLSPVEPTGITNVSLIAAGTYHAVVCTTTGAFYGWGDNDDFDLTQDFNNLTRDTEVHDPAFQGFISVGSGENDTIGLKQDGTVWAFGDGTNGVLGQGNWSSSKEPVQVIGLSNISGITEGPKSAFAIDHNGALSAWGGNWSGQLGIGNNNNQNTPTPVSTSQSVLAVASGDNHTLIVELGGTVWATGDDSHGELGDGTTNPENTPIPITALGNVIVTQVATGNDTSFALDTNGVVWAWGQNNSGQLGLGTTGDVSSPTPISGLPVMVAIAAHAGQAIGIDTNGDVWTWGAAGNSNGTPLHQTGLTHVKTVAAGAYHLLAIENNGTLWGWGFGGFGQLGNGSYNSPTTPTQFNDVQGVVAASGSSGTTSIVKADGSLSGFGVSNIGQLGANLGIENYSPKPLFGIGMTETPPTVSITSPNSGATSPLGTAILFQASASASTGSITKIDYYLEGVKLGQSTAGGTWNFTWTPSSYGDYTFEAVAYDSAGVAQISTPITINVPYDSDGNGLPDWWELLYFGQLGNDPNAPSPANDGYTLLQEYQFGANPTLGISPTITILSGNNQTGPAGTFLSHALTVKVTNANAAGKTLTNFPVTFSVAQGSGLVSASSVGATSASVQVTTDNNGLAQVYFKQPLVANFTSVVSSAIVSSSVNFTATTLVDNGPPAAPSNFSATSTHVGEIDLTWTNNADNATAFLIQRSTDDSTWTTIATLTNLPVTAYSDSELTQGASYYYQIEAVNNNGPNGTQELSSPATISSSTQALAAPRYAVIDLGLGMTPERITNSGYVLMHDPDFQIFRWYNGIATQLNVTTIYHYETDITEDGTAVGKEVAPNYAHPYVSVMLTWSPNSGQPLITNPIYQSIGFPKITPAHDLWVGQDFPTNVPGLSELTDGFKNGVELGNPVAHSGPDPHHPEIGAYWTGSEIMPEGVNNLGHAVFRTFTDVGPPPNPFSFNGQTLPIPFTPISISNADCLVGTYSQPNSDVPETSVWWNAGTINALPANFSAFSINAATTLINGNITPAYQILGWNSSGEVCVLEMNPQSGQFGLPVPLINLISSDSPWSAFGAAFLNNLNRTINDNGAIIEGATYTSTDPNDSTPAGQHGVLLIPAELAVDSNNDGKIVLANDPNNPDNVDSSGNPLPVDTTSSDKPYKFWLNNDYDAVGAYSQYPTVQNDGDPSANPPDYADGVITCTRDLEDFTLMCVYVKGFTNAIKNGDIQVGLKIVATDGSPGINLYQSYEQDGKTTYLTDATMAGSEQTADDGTPLTKIGNTVDSTHPLLIPKQYFNASLGYSGLSDTNPKRYFIFEATSRGKGKLILTFNKPDGTEIGEGPAIYFDLKDIKEMYERWTVGDGNGDTPAGTATLSTRALPSGVSSPFQYSSSGPEDKKYIVFVHGWNLEPWEKDSFAETAFKRLYWQGYKGHFAAFQWPTTYGFNGNWYDKVFNRENYDSGEFSAWRSAPALANLLASFNSECPGAVNIFGHSMGNVVTGEALRLLGRSGQSINCYVACQAAQEAEAYDPTTATNYPLAFTYANPFIPWPGNLVSINYGPSTPDIYPSWLSPNSSGVTTKYRFYNENDFALSPPVWEYDQITKPDDTGIFTDYGWDILGLSNPNDPTVDPNKFYSYVVLPVYHSLDLGSQATPNDRYEIMSYAAEARSRALGRTPGPDATDTVPAPSGDVAGFNGSLNLETIWPVDTAGQGNHKDLQWHSAEFEFTNDQQVLFWYNLLNRFGIPSTYTPPP